jgi:hypothetical protein
MFEQRQQQNAAEEAGDRRQRQDEQDKQGDLGVVVVGSCTGHWFV